jgi:hypothetical protein
MSEEETFIARWSRKKREAEGDTGAAPKAPAPGDPNAPDEADRAAGASSLPPAKRGKPQDSPVDPASLPPLESITSGTDIRAFLQSGVPADLAKAALRRAWAADPAIRDFIEIAENQWDFANPTALPGFGPLAAGDDVRQLVAQALGRLGQETDAASQSEKAGIAVSAPDQSKASTQPIAAGVAPETPAQADEAALTPTQVAEAATTAPEQPEGPSAETGPRPNRRSHGGALPR